MEATLTQPRTYLEIQIHGGEITQKKKLNKSKRKASQASLSFLINNSLNSICDSWLASFSVRIVCETSPFPFIWGSHLCLPIFCETLPVSLCFLSCCVLSSWVYGVNFCGRIPVRFSGTVSLISRSYWSWAVVYVGSVYVFGFWFLLGLSLVGLSHQLVTWGSVCPPPLVFCCAGVGRLCWSWFLHVYKVLRLFSCSCSVVFSE